MGPNAQYYQRHRKTARNYTTVTRFEHVIFGVMGDNFQHFLLVHMLLQTRELHNRRPWALLLEWVLFWPVSWHVRVFCGIWFLEVSSTLYIYYYYIIYIYLTPNLVCTVYPKKTVPATWFTLCCVLLQSSMGDFAHILQGYFTGTGAIIWLPQCLWSNPEGYVQIYYKT